MVRGLLAVQDTSADFIDCISTIALSVAPASGDTDEERESPQNNVRPNTMRCLRPLLKAGCPQMMHMLLRPSPKACYGSSSYGASVYPKNASVNG